MPQAPVMACPLLLTSITDVRINKGTRGRQLASRRPPSPSQPDALPDTMPHKKRPVIEGTTNLRSNLINQLDSILAKELSSRRCPIPLP